MVRGVSENVQRLTRQASPPEKLVRQRASENGTLQHDSGRCARNVDELAAVLDAVDPGEVDERARRQLRRALAGLLYRLESWDEFDNALKSGL